MLSTTPAKAVALSGVHALFNLGFLVLWNGFGVIQSGLRISVSTVSVLQFATAAAILLLALAALFYVLNAPSRRNFGVTTTDALALFFAQWVHGEDGLEEFMNGMGQSVRTYLGAVSFKRRNGSLKAAFLVPQIHYGPFGTLGSSRLPHILSDHFKDKLKAEAFVFHALVNHDMNLVHSRQAQKVADEFESMVRSAKGFSPKGFLVQKRVEENQVAAFGFGKNAFIHLTRAPHSTEDFDLAAGLNLRNLARRHFDEAVVVDRHNSLTNGEMFDVGSGVYHRYADAIESMRAKPGASLKLGTWSNPLPEFSPLEGVGDAGLKVAVLAFGKQKACVVLIDGNNAEPQFRAAVQNRLARFKFDFVDLFTSDTHSVNTIGGIHNPVGARLDPEVLLDHVERAVQNALEDLEPVQASVGVRRIDVSVLGIQRQAELLSTINATVSVARIVAPLVFILALGLVLLALRWVG